MPTLTGTLTDVTGGTIEPEDVLGVSVKAPVARVGAQIVTTRTVPVDVDAGGQLSVDLEPGPAVLVVRAESSTDSWDLAVTGDMSQIREAIIEDVGTLPEWDQSVLLQLAKQVREDAIWADESRAVVADSRDAAAASEQAAATSEGKAKASEDAAAASESAAATSEGNAKASEDAAAASESAAASSESAAANSAGAASASASAAASSEAAARGHAEDAGEALTETTAERATVEQIRAALEDLLNDSAAWAGFEQALAQLEPRMAAEIDKLKGDAPEAFDTLGEVAAWIADSEDTTAALMQAVAEKAEKGHKHTVDDVTDLPAIARTDAEGMSLVQRTTQGHIYIEDPQNSGHGANKRYVDEATSGLAASDHTHAMNQVNGLDAALDGFEPAAWQGTRAEYDALSTKDPNRTYYILEG